MTKSASPTPGERVAMRLVMMEGRQPILMGWTSPSGYYCDIGLRGDDDKEARQYLREIRAIIASAVDAEIKRSKKR